MQNDTSHKPPEKSTGLKRRRRLEQELDAITAMMAAMTELFQAMGKFSRDLNVRGETVLRELGHHESKH